MDDYAGRVLADRYRLPLPPSDEYDLVETRAFDTYSGQEVLVRQVPLPEVVDAEFLDGEDGGTAAQRRAAGRTTRRPTDPAVRRAIEAAQAAAQIPDHPRLDQVFDVFAEGGSLWVVSELVAARPLAALLAEKPLSPYRAAEIGSDVLTALRVLHAHGWTHRNITTRTVLVCDDGRVVLTGLAAGAAEEALCGYAPVPVSPDAEDDDEADGGGSWGGPGPGGAPGPGDDPEVAEPTGYEEPAATGSAPPVPDTGGDGPYGGIPSGVRAAPPLGAGAAADVRAARAGAIAAYRAGARAAARVSEERRPADTGPFSVRRPAPRPVGGPRAISPYGDPDSERRPYGDAAGGRTAHGDDHGARRSPHGDRGSELTPYGGPGGQRTPYGDPGGERTPYGDFMPVTEPGTGGDPDARSDFGSDFGSGYGRGPVSGRDADADFGRASGPGSGRASGPGPGRDADADAGPGFGRGAGSWPGRDSGFGYESGSGFGFDSGARPGRGPASVPDAEPDAGPSVDPDAGPDADVDGDRDPGYGYGSEADPHSGSGPDSGSALPPRRSELAGTWQDAPEPGRAGATGATGTFGPGAAHTTGPPRGSGAARTGETLHGSGAAPIGAPRRSGDVGGAGLGREADAGRSEGSWHGAVPRVGAAGDGLRADGLRHQAPAPAPQTAPAATGRWDEYVAGGRLPAYRGPATPLAAERARQARISLVGAVTERWAPEQAGSVHGNWQLAPPIGPSTDLWALGALLFRTVQGHAPYPEESAIELVQLVCAEPPAFAEECGPLRPVVESLLRQDPTERPDFEELRGWLRSLVRSAPEPEAGTAVVPLPAVDSTRLPVVRRRGELVRRRRPGSAADLNHGRHRHKKSKQVKPAKLTKPDGPTRLSKKESRQDLRQESRQESRAQAPPRAARPPREPRIKEPRIQKKQRGGAGSLGRTLLVVILLGLVAALVYAMVFMPKSGEKDPRSAGKDDGRRTAAPNTPGASGGTASAPPPATPPKKTPTEQQPQTSVPAGDVAAGYALRMDAEGFQIAVDKDWRRRPVNDAGQVRYQGGDFELLIVPGRDSVKDSGSDPMDYQLKDERELQAVRDSSWATSSGLRRIEVGRQSMAEGQFTWKDSSGRDVYVRNLAMIVEGRYHVVQVIGPEAQRDEITKIYEQASETYRVTG
ncbi:protein kinase [Streptomyces sp. H27-C3]|uniref:protein kinase n=1 Tax=Streptomyces sp. H27-C3 TaxID=3046305 RepID=UPI0024B9FD76|nr:protein kinase [Streptomyces sp. H27-C3]MDJ0466475.1 protein kinase [Streptomyces sp. H27-C3]